MIAISDIRKSRDALLSGNRAMASEILEEAAFKTKAKSFEVYHLAIAIQKEVLGIKAAWKLWDTI